MKAYLTIIFERLVYFRLIPFYKFTLYSSLDKEKIKTILQLHLETNNSLNFLTNRQSRKIYEGYFENDILKFRRIPKQGFNSFLPIFEGIFDTQSKNTKIRFKVRFAKVVNTMFIIFALTFLVPTIYLSMNSSDYQNDLYQKMDTKELREAIGDEKFEEIFRPKQTQKDKPDVFVVIILASYILSILYFHYEINNTKSDLMYMLSAKEE